MSKYQKYYKERIEQCKNDLHKVYVTAIADLIEENPEKAEQIFIFNGDTIIKEPKLVWADKYHINTNETEFVVENETSQYLEKKLTIKLSLLSNKLLESIYNELSY